MQKQFTKSINKKRQVSDIGKSMIRPGLFVLLLLSLASGITSQSPATKNPPSAVPLSNEPHHRLTFENSYVRVWETLIPPGDATLWHLHGLDHVTVSLNDASVRVETVGDPAIDLNTKRGETGFRKGSIIHRTVNLGPASFRNLAIELLGPAPPPPKSKRKASSKLVPIIDNERVRIYRVELAAGESIHLHAQSSHVLAIAIGLGEVLMKTYQRKDERLILSSGDSRWYVEPGTHSLKNVGATVFEALEIELK